MICSGAFAQTNKEETLIIRNVNVITNSSDSSLFHVNLLIIDDKLELVSSEVLTKKENSIALDAKGGYLIGNLTIDTAPKFLILKKDPRKNFDLWLNMEPHIIFAIYDGNIRINKLEEDNSSPENQKDPYGRIKWFAYTPPPFALPVNYSDGSKWNHWNTKHFKGLFFAALAMDRLYWLSQNDDSKTQIGSLESNAGGEIRGLRFGAIGTVKFLKKPWSYTVFVATNAFEKGFEDSELNNLTFYDYRLDIPLPKQVTLSIGKQKEPSSIERVPSSLFNSMQERASDAFQPGRNIGAQLSGNLLKKRMSWAAGVFNPFIEKDGGISDNETVVVGRVTGVPWASKTGNNLLHIGVSNRYSNGNNGAQYGITPEFNKSINFIETDHISTNSMNLTGAEIGWMMGPYWIFSEYIFNHLDVSGSESLNFNQFQITGSWILSGEHRSYRYNNGTTSPIPVAIGVNQGGRGAWELTARFSNYDLIDRNINYGLMNIYSLGLNWWPTEFANVSFNFRYGEVEQMGVKGRTTGLNTRLLLLLN
ncbi:OprO/OprP family phosphate-selective porin [Reichenbachiella carrageenanivorans]|uniref:OprO/OprP family phosphate-selective porin n=1 Tax=Reichenbachiella carrageenanivorans TaxID=2979869 RepID=A0ABY6D5C2_9BACT|nr:OprO/OprP family phosphate-selective porin [Reichenbachiella carrageenanivorans]UXX81361.1 OprO/OprP family phosphate-selective porin [Reichenbachiella carrageenanivorans]